MLWDHLASSRLTSTRRSRITTDPVFLRLPSCHSRKSLTLKLLWGLGEEKKRQGLSPGMMRGPVWGGRHAAGKRHSQPFRAKSLPHPWVVSRGTKPVGLVWR